MLCYVSLEVGGNNDVYIIMRGLDSRTDRTDRTGQDRLVLIGWRLSNGILAHTE